MPFEDLLSRGLDNLNIAFIYRQFMDYKGEHQLIGGIETYLYNLSLLCEEIGWSASLYQVSLIPFRAQIGSLRVIGLPLARLSEKEQRYRLHQYVSSELDIKKDIIIFGADHFSVLTDNPRCISIQHGIAWDLPSDYLSKLKLLHSGYGSILKRVQVSRTAIKDFNNCMNRVCVDYNFLNWYRALIGGQPGGRLWIIPNFSASLSDAEQRLRTKTNIGNVRILFARRFTDYRGVKIMADAAEALLNKYSNVSFSFAGEGVLENWLKNKFAVSSKVHFLKYLPHESLRIHCQHDIAVIPSIGSEGTSLSVAEAMSAGCAVVASNVGGITNMVIDGYNGMLIMPDSKSIVRAIEQLISNDALMVGIRNRGYETAVNAFSVNNWKLKWKNVFSTITNGY